MPTADVVRTMAKRVRPKRYTYPMLAAHLGVSRRTLIRWVVAGSIPSPTTVGTQCFWEGRALAQAFEGAKLPETYEYVASPREARRAKTLRKNTGIQAGRKGNVGNRRRIVKAVPPSVESQT